MDIDASHRRQLAHFVSHTSAAVAYDTRVLVIDSYATIRRSMRRTAAVMTRVRRDLIKREVDQHILVIFRSSISYHYFVLHITTFFVLFCIINFFDSIMDVRYD